MGWPLAEGVDTHRRIVHRLAQVVLAIAMIITVELVKWADRSSRTPDSLARFAFALDEGLE